MIANVRSALAETLMPLFRRPPVLQLAALCHRKTETGREVLLVTSSHGRWILPKGWPIDGKTGGETALQEAWEEAGVSDGKVAKQPLGSYPTIKRIDGGPDLPCEMTVYPVKVRDVANDYPEADRRERRWVSIDKAVEMVDDDGLRRILTAL